MQTEHIFTKERNGKIYLSRNEKMMPSLKTGIYECQICLLTPKNYIFCKRQKQKIIFLSKHSNSDLLVESSQVSDILATIALYLKAQKIVINVGDFHISVSKSRKNIKTDVLQYIYRKLRQLAETMEQKVLASFAASCILITGATNQTFAGREARSLYVFSFFSVLDFSSFMCFLLSFRTG